MKTLYLVRHAKSSWDHPGMTDFDRPLMTKGIRKAKRVIAYLLSKNIRPDLMVSSPATRALETARLFAKGLDYPPEKIIQNRKIYEGFYDNILDIIYETANNVDSLMLFGHNPTISHLVNLFLHPGVDDMTTSAVAAIRFHTDEWEGIPAAKAEQLFIISPKQVKK